MNRYQLLKDHEDTIYLFVKAGVMSYKTIRDIEIYESYVALEKEPIYNFIKYDILAEEYELSTKTIEQIVYQMQREV